MTDEPDDGELTDASGIMSGAFGAHALKARLGDQAATWVSLAFLSVTHRFDRVSVELHRVWLVNTLS